VTRWADPQRIDAAVRAFVAELRVRRPEVRRVLWYGSWVTGIPTATSDVDLCIIIDADDRPVRHRVPDYLHDHFPTGIDVTVLTEQELRDLRDRAPRWHAAITSGIELA
jgi:predicted nucleotidyltransferase